MLKYNHLLRFIFVSFLILVQGCNNRNNDISDADREFMTMAGSAGIMEVEMGKLAVANAIRQDLKNYGQMMVKEHSDFNIEFKQMLEKIGEKVPDGMNERNSQMVEELSKLRGQTFDSAYAMHMVEDHKLGVQKFSEALNIAKNQDYKNFLEKGLRIVSVHYKEALKLTDGIVNQESIPNRP